MERQIRSARYDMDAGKVFIMYEDGGRAYCYVDEVEKSLSLSTVTRTRLDWLLYNDTVSYVELLLKDEMQSYLDSYAADYGSMHDDIVRQLSEEHSAAEAEAMAREFMMYCDAT